MEVEVRLATSGVYKDCVSFFEFILPLNLIKKD